MARPVSAESELRSADAFAPAIGRIALGVGLLGLGLSAVAAFVPGGGGWSGVLRSYILNYVFVISLALGALFFVLIQHVTRAGWSVVVRRLAELTAGTMPILAILFIPVLIPVLTGMSDVYPWSSKTVVAQDESGLLQHKQPYLNVSFVLARAALYFLVWIWLSSTFFNMSREQDRTGDPQLSNRMSRWSAPGLVLYALTATFFAFDVVMSLNPHWYSTIFGVYYFAGCNVGFYSFLIIVLVWLQGRGVLTQSVTTEHYHDVGKLMFAFTVFWTYIAFSQFMLIWYANIPEETVFYSARQNTPWWLGVSIFLLVGKFILPFLTLIARHPKRNKGLLVVGAVWVLLLHWVDMYYLIAPRPLELAADGSVIGEQTGWPLQISDATCLIGLGGLFVYAVCRRATGVPLVPVRDPRLSESLAFENY